MTRKDYVLIAEAIRDSVQHSGELERKAIEGTAKYVSYALRRDNPRFDRGRFMAACGFPASE